MEENRLIGILESAFKSAARESLFIVFTFDMRFDVYGTDYGLKLKILHALEKLAESGEITALAVDTAKVHFNQILEGDVKVIHHHATDTDISVDREEVWMFHNFK